MIAVTRSGVSGTDVFTWVTRNPPVAEEWPQGSAAEIDYNVYRVGSPVAKAIIASTGINIDKSNSFACLIPNTNALGVIYAYADPLQGIDHIEVNFIKVQCNGTWGAAGAIYTVGTPETLLDGQLNLRVPIGLYKLSSGAMVMVTWYYDNQIFEGNYTFYYRTPAGVWQMDNVFATFMPGLASTSIAHSCALIQHPNGIVHFFQHLNNDTAIGLITITEANLAAGIAGTANNQYITAANSSGFGPFQGLPQLRVSIDPNRGGLLLAYQSGAAHNFPNSAVGAQVALCFIGPGTSPSKTFAITPSANLIEKSTGFEIGVDSGGPTVWFASSFLDSNGNATAVKVAAYKGSWQFTDTAFAAPLYAIRDDFGSIYGGGICSGFAWMDSGTLKFVPFSLYPFTGVAGSVVWAKRFGSTGTDYGSALDFDMSGNILVTGVFEGTVDFTGNATGTVGNGLLTSSGGYDIFLAKYTTGGTHIWSRNYGTASVNDTVQSLALDDSGNIILVGKFVGGSIRKLSPTGDILWTKGPVVTNPANQVLSFSKPSTDSQGNIYTTGYFSAPYNSPVMDWGENHPLSTGGSAFEDCFFAKYSPDGVCLFAKKFASFGGYRDGDGVIVDRTTNPETIILCGYCNPSIDLGGGIIKNQDSSAGSLCWLARFDLDGNHIKSIPVGYRSGSITYAFSNRTKLALDANGDIIIIGRWNYEANFGGGYRSGTASDCLGFIVKYRGNDFAWQWDMVITTNFKILTQSLALDIQGNILLVGSFSGIAHFDGQSVDNEFKVQCAGPLTNTHSDIFAAKYNSSGVPVWVKRYGSGAEYIFNVANDVKCDVSSNPIVTGLFYNTINFDSQSLVSAGGLDVFLMKLNP